VYHPERIASRHIVYNSRPEFIITLAVEKSAARFGFFRYILQFGGPMTLEKIIVRSVTPVLLVLALSLSAFADTLRLKDGSIIKGKIVSFSGGSFVVAIGEGSRRRELKFAAVEVDSIQFDMADAAAPARFTERTASSKQPASNPVTVVPIVKRDDPAPRPQPTGEKMKPIEWRVKVLADNTANGWTNSGWVVKKGQRIRISADNAMVSLGRGQKTTASGIGTLEDPQKLLKNVPTGALIAVIGDDNNDFIYVGAEREFTASRDGALFLGINEGNLNDNSGAFNVKIEILPDSAE
jgi:hypothetical protein